jgi:GNAT superfamily N-acetyltransferase
MRQLHEDQRILLRSADEKDAGLILEFIRGLAEYEQLLDQVEATEEGLRKHLFEDHRAGVIIAEYDGAPAGFALYFHNFSTFVGKPGIYIEDLFVKPELRGKGLGKALFARIAALAAEQDCGRLEWACLNWNDPAIAFYKALGGRPLTEWTTFRIAGENLGSLADLSPGA